MKATLIAPGLWAGPFGSLQELDELEDLAVVVSILPIGTRDCAESATFIRGVLDGRELLHRILVTSDTDPHIPAEHIAHVLADRRPTLIHCNAGQNRSTAMAACWLLLHQDAEPYPRSVLRYVMDKRAEDLGRAPKVYAQMEATVIRFGAWLKAAL